MRGFSRAIGPDGVDRMGRVGVIVAARTGSARLPGKVLRPLGGRPMIRFLLERVRAAREVDEVVLATTGRPDDDELARLVAEAGFRVFRGDEDDLVARYVHAAEAFGFDFVVRVTGDCPFVDAQSLDFCVSRARERLPFDIATTKGKFPVGIDYEIYDASTMGEIHRLEALNAEQREHLTLFFYQNRGRFKVVELEPPVSWRSARTFTVDTMEDLERARAIVERLGASVGISALVREGS